MSLFLPGLVILSILTCFEHGNALPNYGRFVRQHRSSYDDEGYHRYDGQLSFQNRASVDRENNAQSYRYSMHYTKYPWAYSPYQKYAGYQNINSAAAYLSNPAANRQTHTGNSYGNPGRSSSSSPYELSPDYRHSIRKNDVPNLKEFTHASWNHGTYPGKYVWSRNGYRSGYGEHHGSMDDKAYHAEYHVHNSRRAEERFGAVGSQRANDPNNFASLGSRSAPYGRGYSSKYLYFPKERHSLARLKYTGTSSHAAVGDPDSITVTGGCPDNCLPDDLQMASEECDRYEDFGCSLFLCGTGADGYQCGIDQLEHDVPVEPGAEIEIESINVFDSIQFKVNLNASFPLRTDFYLLSDATGSMAQEIGEVRAKFKQIVDLFENITDAYFGVGFYRDERDYYTVNGFKNLQSLTGDRSKVYAAINNLQSKGSKQNTDLTEATLVGLHKVATDGSAKWRADSRKILVYFGDQCGHEPTCINRVPITRKSIVEEMKLLNITVIAVSFAPGLDTAPLSSYGCPGNPSPAGAGQGTAIAKGTNGVLLPNTQPKEFIEKLKDAVLNLDRVYDLDLSDCEGKLTVESDPDFPLTLGRGETATVEETVVVQPGACEEGGTGFECDLKYTEGGASLPPTAFRLLTIKGC